MIARTVFTCTLSFLLHITIISFARLQHIKSTIDSDVIQVAYSLCKKIDFCKNINDVIHLKIAEQHCDKLVTFDKDFKKLQKETDITIDIFI